MPKAAALQAKTSGCHNQPWRFGRPSPSVQEAVKKRHRADSAPWVTALKSHCSIVSRSDLMGFRKSLETAHAATGNQRLKLVRVILKNAKEMGQLRRPIHRHADVP